jgi:hypothetical protein
METAMKTIFSYLFGVVFLASMLVSAVSPAVAKLNSGLSEFISSAQFEFRATGGPDEFGYTWDDGVDYEWIDVFTAGTDLELTGSNNVSDPVEIGFSFPFYENNYSEVYITTNGWITFDDLPPDFFGFSQTSAFLNPKIPNNLIAPIWENWRVNPQYDGAIYTLTGGVEPNRFFVVAWYKVYKGTYYDKQSTFQVVMHENGDIVMQYLTMPEDEDYYGIVGIEDSRGMDGLNYPYSNFTIDEGLAVKFISPGPTKRIYLSPSTQESLINIGSRDYELHLINIGTEGPDTYTLTSDSVWNLSFFEIDGITEISEPIFLNQGQGQMFIARVTAPAGAETADRNTANVTVISSDTTKSKTATIYSTIPAPFAQVFIEGQVSTYLISPEDQNKVDIDGTTNLSGDESATSMAILALPNGNLMYAWSEYRDDLSKSGWLIHYSILDREGNVVLPRTLLSDLSGGGSVRKDFSPNLAVTPDGKIGVLWDRMDETFPVTPYRFNYHVRFAQLDINGDIIKKEYNISQDETWHQSFEIGREWYYRRQIIATDDGGYIVFWIKTSLIADNVWDYDIYYVPLNNNGEPLTPIQKITNSQPPYPGLDNLTVGVLSGGQIFMAWTVSGELFHLVYMLFTIDGSSVQVVKDKTYLSEVFIPQDVAQLSDGKIILAGISSGLFRYVLIDEIDFDPIDDTFTLPDPIGSASNKNISITSDGQANAILTYQTMSPTTNTELLMYALVSSDGTLVTNPVPFHSAHTDNLYVSRYGHSNTTYSPATYTEVPIFTSESSKIFTVGIDDSFEVLASGQPSPMITIEEFSGDVLPDGMSFYAGTGSATLSGTPTEGSGGIYELVFIASNGIEPDAVQTFTLIVQTVADIDEGGGTITSNEGSIEIQVQPGAVAGVSTFTLLPQAEPTESTGSLTFAGISFQLTAEDGEGNPITIFDAPLMITIMYDPDALGEIDPETLRLYKWDGDEWVDAICDGEDYERGEHWFSLPICHLCEFAVLGEMSSGYKIFLPLILH